MKAHEASSEKETRDEQAAGSPVKPQSYRTTNRGTVQSVILVAEATGNAGRHVVSQLLRAGSAVRASPSNPEFAGLPGDVGVARSDLSLPETLGA
jgi:hypothetical protein